MIISPCYFNIMHLFTYLWYICLGNIICSRNTSEDDDSYGTRDHVKFKKLFCNCYILLYAVHAFLIFFQKPCKHNPIIVAITTGECHHSGSIIRNIPILLIKVIHHLLLRMIFPASLLVISQAMVIHLSLVITCFIFHNLILNLYFLAVAHHYRMSLTSVQWMRYPMPRPSLSNPVHETPRQCIYHPSGSAPKVSTSRHVVNLCSGNTLSNAYTISVSCT
jgi:hypothetical protein